MFNRRECKAQALKSLKGKWGTPIAAYLVFFGITFVAMIPYIMSVFNIALTNDFTVDNPVNLMGFVMGVFASLLIMIAFSVCILPPLVYGWKKIIVLIANNQDVSVKDLFSGFKCYGKSMGLYWWNSLWISLWTLAAYIPLMILITIFIVVASIETSAAIMILPILIFAVMICMYWIAIYKSISYGFMWNVAIDDSSVGVIESMNISKTITKGNVGRLFVLDLSFLGWILLSFITFGIGLLWVIPYSEVTSYNAYKVLRDEKFGKKDDAIDVNAEPVKLVNKIVEKDDSEN